MKDLFTTEKVTVLGKTFDSEEERRTYFRGELRKQLPELKKIEGFPIGEDEDILNLSDPPYYTACPNPWLNDFIAEWEQEKVQLEKEGKRTANFVVDEPYATDVSEGKSDSLYKAHSYHTKVPYRAILKYILHYTQPGDIILDGFAGTGMVGVAAAKAQSPDLPLKLLFDKSEKNNLWGGRRTISNDLSPIASFISYNYQLKVDLPSYEVEANKILKAFTDKFHWMYETTHSNDQIGRINFVVWSEILLCNNCNSELIFSEIFFDSKSKKVKDTSVCPICDKKVEKKELEIVFQTETDGLLEATTAFPKRIPYIINYSYRGKVFEKFPDQFDYEKLDQIKTLPFPKFPLVDVTDIQMSKVGRVKTSNVTHLHHFYLKRAAISISFIWNEIEKISNLRTRNFLYFLFEQMIWGMSILNRYSPSHFSQVNRYLSGVFYIASHCSEVSPFYIIEGKLSRLISAFSKHQQFDNLHCISTGDCSKIQLGENSVDYIFTDPPFGENIYYSDLNLLIESWHKVSTNTNNEAIIDRSKSKLFFAYHDLMQSCFNRYFHVLKSGGWMTVEFSNTNASIWNSIQLAIQSAGFIIANVTSLNKQQGTFQAVNSPTAVKQDLVISCYKPSSEFDDKFKKNQHSDVTIWDFVEQHLHHLPIHLIKGNATNAIVERSPKILYDRLIAFFIQRGLNVPIDAGKFQQALGERFVERDGMIFTYEEVQEYDQKKKENPELIQLSILVSSEKDGVLWLKNLLTDKQLAYQDIQPSWMKALAGVRKGDVLPELATILEENFLKDTTGKWYSPDPENEADLEKLRNKRLLKIFDEYKTEAAKPKGKIKEVRVEALRAGFKQCYQDKDFKSILQIGDTIPNNLLMEDEALLQFYSIANMKV